MSETTLTTMIAELEEAERAVKAAKDKYDDSLVHDDWERYEAALKAQATLMRNTLPTLIEAVKRQGEALELVQQNVEASASSYQERVETIGRVVRAALKEPTDV